MLRELRRLSLLGLAVFLFSSGAFAGSVNRFRLVDLVKHPEQWIYHSGRVARAIDGDTIEMEDGTRIRMAGINSPEVRHGSEPAQPGGDEARAWTAEQLAGKTIRYYVDADNGTDKYGRTVALIFYWTGGSYNIDMIQTGHAKAAYLYLAKDLKDEVFQNAGSGNDKSRISLNSGTQADIDGLPGIGPILGARIVQSRPFDSVDELVRVKGLGPDKLAAVLPFVKL